MSEKKVNDKTNQPEAELNSDILAKTLSESQQVHAATTQQVEITLGILTGFTDQREPLVDYEHNRSGQAQLALTTCQLESRHIGREVALMFVKQQPLVIGVIHNPLAELFESNLLSGSAAEPKATLREPEQSVHQQSTVSMKFTDVESDQEHVVVSAKKSITLQCGDSSLVLRKDGKVILRGRYLLSRATDVNRILGGSIQMN